MLLLCEMGCLTKFTYTILPSTRRRHCRLTCLVLNKPYLGSTKIISFLFCPFLATNFCNRQILVYHCFMIMGWTAYFVELAAHILTNSSMHTTLMRWSRLDDTQLYIPLHLFFALVRKWFCARAPHALFLCSSVAYVRLRHTAAGTFQHFHYILYFFYFFFYFAAPLVPLYY